MFFKLFTFFALVAVAFANPKPEPQVLAYSAPAVSPLGYSAYSPVAYSAQYAAPYAAYPYAYSPYYVR